MHLAIHRPQTSPFDALPSSASAVAKPANAAASAASAGASTASTPSSTPSSTSTATITANDFLQLLVTELKNQDPTADTDPNEYVDQLVQVNSLQQQIQMNETLDGGPTLTGATSGVLQELDDINQSLGGASSSASSNAQPAAAHAEGGNLSSQAHAKTQAAAEKVAGSLAPQASQAGGLGPSQAFEEFAARLKANAQQK